MSEPAGLSMSLDDLIKKRSQGSRGGGQAMRSGGRGGGGLGVRGGGVNKFSDRKGNGLKAGVEFSGRQQQYTPQHRAQGFGGRQGPQRGPFQQRRGGFGGRGAFGARPQHGGGTSSVQTYLDDNTGNVVVKLKDTEVVTVSPSGEIALTTGGWFTQTTFDVMNKALGVLQIHVTATGDVRDGAWQVAYGPHLLRFYDGIILHPKNPATAAQRAPMVLAAMSGAPTPAPATANTGIGAAAGYGAGLILPSSSTSMGALGTNPLAASAAAASTAAALAAGVMARARVALGLGGSSAFSGGLSDVTPAQQQLALAALAAQHNSAFQNITDQAPTDADAIRRLKAQGRL
ncbi:hypothetical protein Vretimale_10054 [Volvox reticuliferus]|uniref:Uncharacterized protein n=1 Tax=Volvox reticuliferus TaxID=1737510 RepID=A0A8J4LQX8_9CHLO|nr:hypothetical protein Vretifemale_785 [Volvox reticuliferus]GIM05597.1 hypothetical protein Vretimale_10054 [Volvox reticuliferus]